MIRRNGLALVFTCVLSMVLPVPVAFAHGGQEHVMGTVKAIDDASITVTTKAKKDVSVQLEASTKFEKGGAAVTAKDISVGDRVVVHSKKGGSGPTAVLVKVGASSAGKHQHAGK